MAVILSTIGTTAYRRAKWRSHFPETLLLLGRARASRHYAPVRRSRS